MATSWFPMESPAGNPFRRPPLEHRGAALAPQCILFDSARSRAAASSIFPRPRSCPDSSGRDAGCTSAMAKRRASAMRLVGDFEFGEGLVVSDRPHFLHPPSRRLRPIQLHRRIRQRQTVRPAAGDARPGAVLVQQRVAKTYRPHQEIVSGADLVLRAIEVRFAQIDINGCSFPQLRHVTAQHHHIEIVGRDTGPYRGTHHDHRDHVLIDLCSFEKRGQPVARMG